MTTINLSTSNNILCELSHLGLLEISGADAVTFLQGQLTNDVKLLHGTNAHYSAYCNPKGRMLALFLAFAHHNNQLGNHYHLQLNRELLEPMMRRLKMYVMRSQVEINDVSDSIVKFGLYGPQAASMLAPMFNPSLSASHSASFSTSFSKVPTEEFELVSVENGTLLKLPSANDNARFEIFTNAANAPLIWNMLKNNCHIVDKNYWELLEIQAGIPDISLATQEQFVPQMLNLDILNAINFKKGCYTGQEIIARTHYLGSVKRRTYLAEIALQPAPGDKVTDAAQSEVGQIVRSAPNLTGSFDVLAEMRIDAVTGGVLNCNDAPILLKTLPYSLDK